MSNVKLITPWNKSIFAEANSLGLLVLDARYMSKESILNVIFLNQNHKIVIFGDFIVGYLPVPDYVFQEQSKNICLSEFVLNSCERTYSADGVKYYDVHKIWYISRHNKVSSLRVQDIMEKQFGDKPISCKDEVELIHLANLNFPIHLRLDCSVIDGCHRLMKAFMNGHERINCIYVFEEQLEWCAI